MSYSILEDQEAEQPCGMQSLWRAVITQALMDAGSNSKKYEARKERARAIAWLHGNSAEFKQVCHNAGMDPAYVKQRAKEAMKNGCKWRKEAKLFEKMEYKENVVKLEFKQMRQADFEKLGLERKCVT